MQLEKFPTKEELDSIRNGTYGFKELDQIDFKECLKSALTSTYLLLHGFSSKNEYSVIFTLPRSFIMLPIVLREDTIKNYFSSLGVKVDLKTTRKLHEYIAKIDLEALYKLSKRFNLEDLFFNVVENSIASLIRSTSIEGKNVCSVFYKLPEEDIIEIRDAIRKRSPNNYSINKCTEGLIIKW